MLGALEPYVGVGGIGTNPFVAEQAGDRESPRGDSRVALFG